MFCYCHFGLKSLHILIVGPPTHPGGYAADRMSAGKSLWVSGLYRDCTTRHRQK